MIKYDWQKWFEVITQYELLEKLFYEDKDKGETIPDYLNEENEKNK